jgi:WXXGXW repeat (2 copies)
MVNARPAEFRILLAIGLGFAPLLAESPAAIRGSASATPAAPIGAALVSSADLGKLTPGVQTQRMLAQADDLAPPQSPDAIVTTPPPAPLAETAPPPPFPGYAWNPGHWTWDGAQYVWEPGRYIVQPTNSATFTPGYWRRYSGGWTWVEGRWNWGTQGEGE